MCGLIGGITRQPVSPAVIDKALGVLHHRGPDGRASWSSDDRRMFLGHTRLSIIGLNNGDQPMTSAAGDVHVAVNGEFYGYREIRDELRAQGARFTTESDSEIALHLYLQRGMRATDALRGEFAVLIADEARGIMIAVRDRFGIKPLFYTVIDGGVVFASEIKALLALGAPARWDIEAAYHDNFICRSHERTMFEGIRSVPQGCYAIARGGEVQIYSYWDWDFPTAIQTAADDRSEAEVVAGFREVLSESVRQRMVADVEVGCYLSGGIDSCAVLGLAQQQTSRPIRAYTLSFDDPRFDESDIARRQAEFVGASVHPVPVTRRDLADAYSDAVWHAETPMVNGHGAAKFLLSKAVHDAGLKVVFTGEGSDELMGGYAPFRRDIVLHHTAGDPKEAEALLETMFAANPTTRAFFAGRSPDNPVFAEAVKRLGWLPSFLEAFGVIGLAMTPLLRDEVIAQTRGRSPFADVLDRLPLARMVAGRDRLHQALYLNSKLQLASFILTFLGDRMEMAHSIEGRVPFLDHKVADYAAHVPIAMKMKNLREKHVLREATKDVLIDEVYNREKHPFSSPPANPADDAVMTMYEDVLASRALEEQPVYDPIRARQALQALKNATPEMRLALDAAMQRIVSTTLIHERFGMA